MADRQCSRCSMALPRWGSSQLCRPCYGERAKAVYWERATACGAGGPERAACLLAAGHDGAHEGNGYDEWGPVSHMWNGPVAPTAKKLKEKYDHR